MNADPQRADDKKQVQRDGKRRPAPTGAAGRSAGCAPLAKPSSCPQPFAEITQEAARRIEQLRDKAGIARLPNWVSAASRRFPSQIRASLPPPAPRQCFPIGQGSAPAGGCATRRARPTSLPAVVVGQDRARPGDHLFESDAALIGITSRLRAARTSAAASGSSASHAATRSRSSVSRSRSAKAARSKNCAASSSGASVIRHRCHRRRSDAGSGPSLRVFVGSHHCNRCPPDFTQSIGRRIPTTVAFTRPQL